MPKCVIVKSENNIKNNNNVIYLYCNIRCIRQSKIMDWNIGIIQDHKKGI